MRKEGNKKSKCIKCGNELVLGKNNKNQYLKRKHHSYGRPYYTVECRLCGGIIREKGSESK